jgi:hypothetical protein
MLPYGPPHRFGRPASPRARAGPVRTTATIGIATGRSCCQLTSYRKAERSGDGSRRRESAGHLRPSLESSPDELVPTHPRSPPQDRRHPARHPWGRRSGRTGRRFRPAHAHPRDWQAAIPMAQSPRVLPDPCHPREPWPNLPGLGGAVPGGPSPVANQPLPAHRSTRRHRGEGSNHRSNCSQVDGDSRTGGIEPRSDFPDASVDPSEARKATVQRVGRSERSAQGDRSMLRSIRPERTAANIGR